MGKQKKKGKGKKRESGNGDASGRKGVEDMGLKSEEMVGDKELLYQVLEIDKDANQDEIKRQYRKLALKYHPDKNAGNEEAATIFQKLSFAYSILSDERKRKYYDQTGDTEEVDVRPEDFIRTFQVMMAEMMGGSSIKDMVEGLSSEDLADMPPFPFPKELFPPGTFPEGMKFCSDGLTNLPPQVEELLEKGQLGDMANDIFASGEEMTAFGDEYGHTGAHNFGTSRRQKRKGKKNEHRSRGGLDKTANGFSMEEVMQILHGQDSGSITDERLETLLTSLQDDDGDEMGGDMFRKMMSMGDFEDDESNASSSGDDEESIPLKKPQDFAKSTSSEKPTRKSMPDNMLLKRRWMDAAKAGDMSLLSSILSSDPSLLSTKGPGVGHTALHWAAARGELPALRFLLDGGAEPYARNNENSTALHSACAYGFDACALELISRVGKNVKSLLEMEDSEGQTAEAVARSRGHIALAQKLSDLCATKLKSNVPQDVPQEKPQVVLTSIPKEPQSDSRAIDDELIRTEREQSNRLASHSSSSTSTSTEDESKNVKEEKKQQRQRLRAAAAAAEAEEEKAEAAKSALKSAFDMKSITGVDRDEGKKWLNAAKNGSLEELKSMLTQNPRLLAYRGQGTSFGFTGNSALHWSSANGHDDCTKFLLQQGCPVDLKNNGDCSALHAAAGNGVASSVEILILAGGADAKMADALGETPKDNALGKGKQDIARLLDVTEKAKTLRDSDSDAWGVRDMRTYLALAMVDCGGLSEKAELRKLVRELLEAKEKRIVPIITLQPEQISPIGDDLAKAKERQRTLQMVESKSGSDEGSSSTTDKRREIGTIVAAAKEKGNLAFRNGEYSRAAAQYSMMVRLDPKNEIAWSNRSGAYAAQGHYEKALNDALKSIKLAPKWGKGYARKGAALLGLGQAGEGVKAYLAGLQAEPESESLKRGLAEAKAEIRRHQQRFEDMWGT